MAKTLCITGGGTGGHLMIAQALAEAAKELHVRCIFIGSTNGQDRAYFQNSPLFEATYFLETSGVVNKKALAKVQALKDIFQGMKEVGTIFKQHQVGAVYSVGGFSAASASFYAILKRIPLFVHEQNAATGKLNTILQHFAHSFISSYNNVTNPSAYPIRDIFFQHQRVRKKIKTIIFLGGSQGALAINNLAIEVAPILDQKGIKIIHQTGKKDFQRVQETYKKLHIDVEVFDFRSNLVNYMDQADLAVSRSGASTLWELCAMGIVGVFIPYPYAIKDHQYYNAKFLADKNLAYVVRENQNPKQLLLSILDEDLEEKSQALIQLTRPHVANEMIQAVQKVL